MFISNQGLKELEKYQYISGGNSSLDMLLNKHLWTPLVTCLPMWVSPNLITFVGFMLMISATILLLVFESYYNFVPLWTLLVQSIAIFLYQTLDALDGKQARRTGSSSVLGQLFDHGCDAAVTILFIIGISLAVGLTGFELFLGFTCTAYALFSINCLESHSGVMHTQINGFGVTEAHYACILVNLISYAFGRQVWHIKILSIQMYRYVFYVFVPGGFILSGMLFYTIFIQAQDKLRVVKEWSTITYFIIISWSWTHLNIFESLSSMIILNFGFLLSLMLSKLIICSKSKESFPMFHAEQIPFYIVTVLQWILQIYDVNLQVPLFWISFWLNLGITVIQLSKSINQIKIYLNIFCFTLKKQRI